MNVSRYSQLMLVVAGAVACSSTQDGNGASTGGGGTIGGATGGVATGGAPTTTATLSGGTNATSSPSQGASGQQQGGATPMGTSQGSSGQGGTSQGSSGQGGATQTTGGTIVGSRGGTTATATGGVSATGVGGVCLANGACSPMTATCKTTSGQSCICNSSFVWGCTGVATGGSNQGGAASIGGAGNCVATAAAACTTVNQICKDSASVDCICNAYNVWSCTSPAGTGGASAAGGAVSTLGGAPATACSGTTKSNTTSTSGAKITLGKYYVVNNQWGASDGSGTQSIWSTCNNGYAIGWGTSFNWSGGASSVKSFASAVIGWHWGWTVQIGNTQMPVQVGGSKTINCDWRYSVTRNGTVTSNIAYDLWIHSVALTGASNEWDVNTYSQYKPTDEIMIWLYRSNGAGPISTTGSPVATASVANTSWDLYVGKITDAWNVYSYVRQQNTEAGAVFDLQDFLKDLVARKYLTTSKYLSSIEAGTEIYLGGGQVDTSSFSCEVK